MRLFQGENNDKTLSTISDIEAIFEIARQEGITEAESFSEYLQSVTGSGGFYTEMAISEMTCKRFLYLFAYPEPISLDQVADEFDIDLHREIPGRLIVTDLDTRIATIIQDPENAGKPYRFVENDTAECVEA